MRKHMYKDADFKFSDEIYMTIVWIIINYSIPCMEINLRNYCVSNQRQKKLTLDLYDYSVYMFFESENLWNKICLHGTQIEWFRVCLSTYPV